MFHTLFRSLWLLNLAVEERRLEYYH